MRNYGWKQKGKDFLFLVLLVAVLWNVWFLTASAEKPTENVCGEGELQVSSMQPEKFQEGSVPEELAGLDTKAPGSFVNWVGGTEYQYQFTAHGVTYLHRSVPFGVYRVTDMGSGNATWAAYFYVKESVLADGKPIAADNLIRYKNVNIQLAYGENTELLQVFLDGNLHTENPSFWEKKKDFAFFTMKTPWWKKEWMAEPVFSGLERNGKDRGLGTGISVSDPFSVTGIGMKTNPDKSLFRNAYQEEVAHFISDTPDSHGLLLQVQLAANKPDGTSAIPAIGCIRFQWDVYNQATLELLEENATKTVTVPYMVE